MSPPPRGTPSDTCPTRSHMRNTHFRFISRLPWQSYGTSRWSANRLGLACIRGTVPRDKFARWTRYQPRAESSLCPCICLCARRACPCGGDVVHFLYIFCLLFYKNKRLSRSLSTSLRLINRHFILLLFSLRFAVCKKRNSLCEWFELSVSVCLPFLTFIFIYFYPVYIFDTLHLSVFMYISVFTHCNTIFFSLSHR